MHLSKMNFPLLEFVGFTLD